jgi:hypothetical protein
MNFPTGSAGEENEHVECIVADVFLRRLVIDLHSLNPVLIALIANAFFWVAGEMSCRCSLDSSVFRLFGDANIGVASIGLEVGEKPDSLFFPRSNDTGKLLFFEPFLLSECR